MRRRKKGSAEKKQKKLNHIYLTHSPVSEKLTVCSVDIRGRLLLSARSWLFSHLQIWMLWRQGHSPPAIHSPHSAATHYCYTPSCTHSSLFVVCWSRGRNTNFGYRRMGGFILLRNDLVLIRENIFNLTERASCKSSLFVWIQDWCNYFFPKRLKFFLITVRIKSE